MWTATGPDILVVEWLTISRTSSDPWGRIGMTTKTNSTNGWGLGDKTTACTKRVPGCTDTHAHEHPTRTRTCTHARAHKTRTPMHTHEHTLSHAHTHDRACTHQGVHAQTISCQVDCRLGPSDADPGRPWLEGSHAVQFILWVSPLEC